VWWRIDQRPPDVWTWTPFPQARHRFDPPSGRFRVRYAASRPAAAARERFPARRIAEGHADLWLVRLAGPISALHLTHQTNLDALGFDDRINTGRLDESLPGRRDPLLDVCQQLADRVYDWWDDTPPPIVYRTRSLTDARSVAFCANVGWAHLTARPLHQATGLLVGLVQRHGFDVPEHWLR
jgi:hypothetical protein